MTQPAGKKVTNATASATLLCPYCGKELHSGVSQCPECGGLLDPLSRQATQNCMGPWFIRDRDKPFQPGCNLSTLVKMVKKGRVGPDTIIRGPTTGQFWRRAAFTPGIGHLFGRCHSCGFGVSPDDMICPECKASFAAPEDRQDLGLGMIHALPASLKSGESKPAAGAQRRATSPTKRISEVTPVGNNPSAGKTNEPIGKPAVAVSQTATPAPPPDASVTERLTPIRQGEPPANRTAGVQNQAGGGTKTAGKPRGRGNHPLLLFGLILISNLLILAVVITAVIVFHKEIGQFLTGETTNQPPAAATVSETDS